jgi:DNA-binding response OmpR family regulator
MDLKEKRILVIEDDATIRNNVVEFLTLYDINVQSSKNGLEGLSQFESFMPEMVICDIMMPEMDGFTFLEELNKRFPFHLSIFLFLTAKNNPADIRKGMNLGADDYILKPFLLDDLLETIRTKFARNDLRKQGIKNAMDEVKVMTNPTPYHEFNTCLNGIMTGAQILVTAEEPQFDLETRSILTIIQQSGLRLYKAINNLILHNEIDATKVIPLIEEIPFSFIESAVVQMANNYERRNDLHLEMDRGILRSDKFLIKKIIEEIADNGFKFTKKGEQVLLHVSKLNDEGMNLKFSWKAHGFNEEMFLKVSPYNQFSTNLNTIAGLGLGLHLSKRLSELLNGQLTYTTMEDGMATFHLTIGDKINSQN